MTAESTLGSAVAARQAHTLEAAGSTPAPATISFCPRCRRLQCGPDSCAPMAENRSTASIAERASAMNDKSTLRVDPALTAWFERLQQEGEELRRRGDQECDPRRCRRHVWTLPWAMIPALLLALTGWGCAGKIPPPVLAAPTVEAGPIGTDGYRVQVAGTLDWWTLHVQPQVEVEFRPGEYVIEVVLPLVLGDASATLRIMAYGPDPASVEACIEAPALLPEPLCTPGQETTPQVDGTWTGAMPQPETVESAEEPTP